MTHTRKPNRDFVPHSLKDAIEGRVKYDKEYCDKLADHLIAEVDANPDMSMLRPYFSGKGMQRDTIKLCCELSEKFKIAYKSCKEICANRFHLQTLQGKLAPYYATRLMCSMDEELWDHQVEDKRRMSKAAVQGATEAGGQENLIQIIVKD